MYLSTNQHDLPGFHLNLLLDYPTGRTSARFSPVVCDHRFRHHRFVQTRKADEAPTAISRCEKCHMETVN